jgi:hypothetical protein
MSCFTGEVSSIFCCQVSMDSLCLDNGVEVRGQRKAWRHRSSTELRAARVGLRRGFLSFVPHLPRVSCVNGSTPDEDIDPRPLLDFPSSRDILCYAIFSLPHFSLAGQG